MSLHLNEHYPQATALAPQADIICLIKAIFWTKLDLYFILGLVKKLIKAYKDKHEKNCESVYQLVRTFGMFSINMVSSRGFDHILCAKTEI